MPGIVGLITRMPRVRAEEQVDRMLRTIRHDLSYTTGTWSDESLGVYVGWASHAGSLCDGMPHVNEGGDVVLVFSGEEYPATRTVADLQHAGHEVDSKPASYLVHLYEADPSFPAGLNGRFQGLSIDRRVGKATLFNDRSGMHRVYYHESKDAFYFSAEAKAILAVRPELRRIDPRGLGEFVTCGCTLENRTLFTGIGVLPPASAWDFENGSLVRRRSYFQPSDWEGQGELEPETYYRTLRDVFTQTLPRYLTSGKGIGMSLTGGLDTRMIMAWWRPDPDSIPCYSFAGPYRDSEDVRLGRKLAVLWGQPHHTIRVEREFLSKFPEYAQRTVYLTDGCADVSASPILYTNERAREMAPTRMTGNYGGEVLRRNVAFKAEPPLPGLFCSDMTPHFSSARGTYQSLRRAHPVTFAVFYQAPWHHHGLFALENTQLTVRSPYLDNDLLRTVYRSPAAAYDDSDVCLRLIGDGNRDLRRIRTDRGVGRGGLHGAVSRAMLEFTFKADYAYNHGMPQWLARLDHVLSSFHCERLFLGRHKYTHYRVWYRDALSQYLRQVLLESRTLQRWYLNPKTVERIVTRHLGGQGNYTFEISSVLTLELLHRSLLDAA